MAGLPPITQLAGNQWTLFEGYWSHLDPQGSGKVDAGSAATFLKRSQLREPVLHKIWNMSDPSGNGYLDKQGLFMALRLIAVCQAGKEPLVSNMALSDPPPKLVGVETPPTTLAKESDRAKYEKTFQGLQPNKGLLGGDKAKPFMLSSKLPLDTLGKIWTLSDIDKDGNLDLDEFCVAMKLIAMAKGGEVLPATLPASLVPPSKQSAAGVKGVPPTSSPSPSSSVSSVLQPTVMSSTLSNTSTTSPSPSHTSSPLPTKKSTPPVGAVATPLAGAVATPLAGVEWVVSKELQAKYEGYFQGIDKDHDGYVSGEEARSLFMASNLQQTVLAHIWNLCDIERDGRLNAEQFALAMYLIAEKVRDKDIPDELTPAMVPPSLRGKVTTLTATPLSATASSTSSVSSSSSASMWGGLTIPTAVSSTTNTSVTWTTTPTSSSTVVSDGVGFGSDFSAIQELDSITHEIGSIRKEKVELAEDIKAKQELIQQRKVELEGFQEDVDQATKQRETLEREREEARTLLEQLNTEKAKFEGQIAELKQNCDDEREEIGRLKVQLSEQQTSNRSKSEELEKLKEQFEQLTKEEREYKQKVEVSKTELEKLQKANHNIQSDITQVRQRIENLKEEQQSLSTVLTLYPPTSAAPGPTPSSGVVNINDVGKLSAELHVPHMSEHDAISARATAGSSSPVSSLSGFSTNSHLDDGAEDGGGAKEDKRSSDPFASTGSSSTSRDPFAAFSIPTSEDSFGGGRSFSGSKPSDLSVFDPFGTAGSAGANFDPFKSSGPAPATGEDMFKSSDPFSATSSTHISNSSSTSSLPHANVTVDPFSGQDPFNADPFASATTPSSTSTTSNNKETTQPTSLWGSSSLFDMDPFGQQNIQTPTDPFSGRDPFGEDPFAVKSGGGGSSGSSNPFQVGGGSGGFGAAAWKQDGGDRKPS